MSKKITYKGLRKFNLIMAGLHALQGLAILVISNGFTIPVTNGYLRFNESSQQLEPATVHMFDLPVPWLIAGFFFLSALAHLTIATIYRKQYQKDLKVGINRLRWVEYSISASIMMVAIATLVGIYDLSSLIMIFTLSAVMNLMGLVMEIHNQTTTKTSWLSYWIGSFAGIVPWLAVALYIWESGHQGSGVPTFVYWIFVSIFVFFSCFAINMVLQYKKIGKWKDYLYGEQAYIVLSLVAKSLLAWQVFFGTLRP